MHLLLLIFAVLGGLLTFGFVGLFLGPVIFSLLVTLLPILREEMGAGREESPQAG